jgi:asparagine synthase (glutamine-hydrolysing)
VCGITGLFAYADRAPPPSEAELIAIRDRMAARGPDAASAWRHADGRVAFGHRRLSIIDLSDRATQPMASDDGRLVIVFNGEIYNYAQLRAELEAESGRPFRTTSDTEVLLRLYEAEGAAMVERLRGMFALAIWDDRRRGLLLARDPYGIKPLYYVTEGGVLRFASQVKALLAGGQVSREPDAAGLVGFHLFGHVPEPFTTWRAISSLPAGSTLWADEGGVGEPRRYANLAQVLADAAAVRPEADLRTAVREAALDSVRAHLVADVEVGAFLSAGIDSGAVVGLMRDAGQSRIRTLTLAYDEYRGTDRDEAPLAEQVAALYGADHVTRVVTREEFQADLPLIMEAMDQPSIDGINTWFVSKASRELGLKVALSGVGGDELLGGYSTFRDVPRWRRLFGPLAATPGLGSLSRVMLRAFAPGLLRRKPKVVGLLEYPRTWEGAYFLRRAVRLPIELASTPLTRQAIDEGLRRLEPLGLIAGSMRPDPGSDAGRVCVLESANYMRSQLLRDTDWAGMAHSLEIRTPLVDFTLLKRLAPHARRFGDGSGKQALAMAPSTPLPPDVARRAKTGFGIPVATWSAGVASDAAGLGSRQWAQDLVNHASA